MQVEITDGTHHFVCAMSTFLLLLVGRWFKVNPKVKKREDDEEELEKLPTILEGETLVLDSAELLKQVTKPVSPLYTEATLLCDGDR